MAKPTYEELEAELKKMADQYQMELSKVKEILGEEETKSVREDIAVQKAVDFLVENAKPVKAKKADKEEKDEKAEKPAKASKSKEADTEKADKKPAKKTAKKED